MPSVAFPFDRDGYRHRLLERTGAVCLIERTNRLTGSVHWEVVRVRPITAHVWPNGRLTEAGERYPSTAEWGACGWTFTTRDDATRKYRFLSDASGQKGGYQAKAIAGGHLATAAASPVWSSP